MSSDFAPPTPPPVAWARYCNSSRVRTPPSRARSVNGTECAYPSAASGFGSPITTSLAVRLPGAGIQSPSRNLRWSTTRHSKRPVVLRISTWTTRSWIAGRSRSKASPLSTRWSHSESLTVKAATVSRSSRLNSKMFPGSRRGDRLLHPPGRPLASSAIEGTSARSVPRHVATGAGAGAGAGATIPDL